MGWLTGAIATTLHPTPPEPEPEPNMSSAARCLQAVSACLVCTESYDVGRRRPKLLHCGHTFCQSCLSKIARLAASTERHGTSTSGSETLVCPNCRVATPLLPPHHTVAHLTDNFAIVDFITGDHSVAELVVYCAKHPDERGKYFCMSCCRLLCPGCALEHASQAPSHTLRDVESAAGHFRQRLHLALDYCTERLELLERVLKDTAEERRQISALRLSLEHLTGSACDAELLSQTHTLMGLQDPQPHLSSPIRH